MPLTIDWLGAWNDPESKVHIHREIVNAFGNRTGSVNFQIGNASDGVGITIKIRGTPYPDPASLILWSDEEWRKHGVLEKKVRKVLEDAEEGPGSAERSMLGQAFEPDITVTDTENSDIALVVEAKTSVPDLENSERQLKRFMAGVRCPVGLIVTPQRLWLYRNRYLSSSEDSVARVAGFDIGDVLHFEPSGAGRKDSLAFEGLVQEWLEGLGTEASLRELPADLRRAVQSYIVPAISQGTIRAGHPRLMV